MTMKQAFFSSKPSGVNDFFSKNTKEKKSSKDNFFTKLLVKSSKNA
ncbi:hypothetical protein ACR3FT_001008 [Yersinia enterocolitica]|nr:hypothetical protein [Yersinia enterocolitica]EKN3597062.1 hypothetical protein [Yersinia enterocolitica]EKN3834205.1 hypothetical protein [Yersinia enterocolitica]EKN4899788.1 hypothetical protein [Yersinia enterocolitica]ELI8161768.1 hypothetical protein [Yersinia enterocolitica]